MAPNTRKILVGVVRLGTIVPGNAIPIRFMHDAMDLKEVIAVNVRRARHASGLTQEELAARANLSLRYVGAIERARVSASVTVLGRLATALTVDPHKLIEPFRKKAK